MDPYLASLVVADTTLLKESMIEEVVEHYDKWYDEVKK
jgi:hypothetical protein